MVVTILIMIFEIANYVYVVIESLVTEILATLQKNAYAINVNPHWSVLATTQQ